MTLVVAPDADAVRRAAAALREGKLVAFPTETVYGLGADAANAQAVRSIFVAKGRPPNHPVIVHVADTAMAERWSRTFPAGARALADAFWPGALTLILPRAAGVLDDVTGGQDSVGLRVPAHPVAQALLRAFGGGIAAPSANRFGHVSSTTAAHVAEDVGDGVAMILDAGPCEMGIESTIVSFVGSAPSLLRPGAVSAEALARVLGRPLLVGGAGAPRASGTLAAHYAPRTPASLVAPDILQAELLQLVGRDERVAVLARSEAPAEPFEGVWIWAPPEPDDYAHDLYANLRKLDVAAADAILIEDVPDRPDWQAVRDRLTRATQRAVEDRD